MDYRQSFAGLNDVHFWPLEIKGFQQCFYATDSRRCKKNIATSTFLNFLRVSILGLVGSFAGNDQTRVTTIYLRVVEALILAIIDSVGIENFYLGHVLTAIILRGWDTIVRVDYQNAIMCRTIEFGQFSLNQYLHL